MGIRDWFKQFEEPPRRSAEAAGMFNRTVGKYFPGAECHIQADPRNDVAHAVIYHEGRTIHLVTPLTPWDVQAAVEGAYRKHGAKGEPDTPRDPVAALVAAWTVEGRHPPYHRQQQERLRREWPDLYRAVTRIADQYPDRRGTTG